MTEGRFRCERSRVVLSNRRYDVCLDDLRDDAGRSVEGYLILRPHVLKDGVSGVCVLPEAGGRVGLMRTHRHHFDAAIWQAPAGFCERDESVEETARRELLEETGLVCADGALESLGLMIPDAGVFQAKVALFVARGAAPARQGQVVTADEPGMAALEFFEAAELRALALESAAMGSATQIACWRYLERALR